MVSSRIPRSHKNDVKFNAEISHRDFSLKIAWKEIPSGKIPAVVKHRSNRAPRFFQPGLYAIFPNGKIFRIFPLSNGVYMKELRLSGLFYCEFIGHSSCVYGICRPARICLPLPAEGYFPEDRTIGLSPEKIRQLFLECERRNAESQGRQLRIY
jgi:hypothetical protein